MERKCLNEYDLGAFVTISKDVKDKNEIINIDEIEVPP